VVDTGIDSGLAGGEHPALAGRLLFALDESGGTGAEDCAGHGTHIAGIIAGDPPPGFDLADEDGYQFGLGLAPTARLGASRIFTCDGGFATARSYSEILGEAWQLGARISNNSWGGTGPSYTALAREFDGLVRDANGDPSDGDQPMVVVASSGNSGPQPLTIGAPSLAKNVIAVGGTESYRPEGTDGCGGGPTDADDPAIIRRSSSRGPTTDGRIKPDLVAPGSHILSTVSQSGSYTGLGLCDTFYPPGQRLYSWTSGTSQSAAHVSGAAVLMMEDYRRQFGAMPSPAMVKAGLVATARDLGNPIPSSGAPISSRPSGTQGWGRVDLGNLVGHRLRAAFDQDDLFTSAGQEAIHGPFLVADPNRPVSVVLAWTDAPGSPAASSWVNDLDLEVTTSGAAYLGNVLEDGFSVPGGVPDGRNNLEAIFLEPGAASTLTARVMAVSLPGDGVPSAAGATDQDYALYIDNVIAPAPAGRISLDRTDYACSDTVFALVTDRSLSGGARVHVEAASSSEPTPEILELFEDPPGTGIFRGTIPLGAGSPGSDGVVQVSDGDTLTVTYTDNDMGDGTAGQVAATATTHCSPLVITGVQVESIGEETAVVTWTTNRPADSVVTGSPGIDARDPSLVTVHRVILRELTPCAAHAYRVSSTDAGGATAEAPATGSITFNTTAGLPFPLFHNDFEGFGAPWPHSGTGDEWELGAPIGGPGSAASGTRAWGTDLDGPYEEDADITLRMPPVNLHHLRDATLFFRHSHDIPLALSPGDPQDGAWVEGSIDAGVTWLALAPAGGYPAAAGPGNPHLQASSGVFAGSNGWAEARFDLSPLLGGEILIRFRLWRDPDSATPPGAGWFIDDVTVEAAFPCGKGTLTLDAPAYGCSSVVAIRLADADVDPDPQRTGLASVIAEGPSGSLGIQLTETASDSRVYTGSISLTSGSSPGSLAVAEGDQITIRYQDDDDGTGAATAVDVDADVTDCSAPSAPSSLLVEHDGSGRLRITWNDPPDADLSEVRIHYDSDSPGPIYTGSGAAEGASPLRSEGGRRTAFLSGLPACIPHYISMTAMDLLGNESGFSAEVVGVPFAGSPCPRATIALAGAAGAGCSQNLPVRIDDANADADPSTPGSITALATSASASSPLTVTLAETGPATGTFTGFLPLTASPAAGKLQVIEGDLVVLTYDDLDAGYGPGVLHHPPTGGHGSCGGASPHRLLLHRLLPDHRDRPPRQHLGGRRRRTPLGCGIRSGARGVLR
jgi:hypothetical protein